MRRLVPRLTVLAPLAVAACVTTVLLAPAASADTDRGTPPRVGYWTNSPAPGLLPTVPPFGRKL